MVKCLMVLCLFIASTKCSFSFEDDDALVEQTKSEMQTFLLDIEFGLPERLTMVTIIAESSADSAMLFRSVGNFGSLRSKEYVWKECSWSPEIFVDDRAVQSKTHSPICVHSEWSRLEFGPKAFDITGDLKRGKFEISKFKGTLQNGSAAFIDLFDLPFLFSGCFNVLSAKPGLARIFFESQTVCISAKQVTPTTIESVWVRPENGRSQLVVQMTEGKPTLFEIVSHQEQEFDSKHVPNRDSGKLLCRVSTQWTIVDDSPVPRAVQAIFTGHSVDEGYETISLRSSVQVFKPGSKEYQARAKILAPVLERIEQFKD